MHKTLVLLEVKLCCIIGTSHTFSLKGRAMTSSFHWKVSGDTPLPLNHTPMSWCDTTNLNYGPPSPTFSTSWICPCCPLRRFRLGQLGNTPVYRAAHKLPVNRPESAVDPPASGDQNHPLVHCSRMVCPWHASVRRFVFVRYLRPVPHAFVPIQAKCHSLMTEHDCPGQIYVYSSQMYTVLRSSYMHRSISV